MTTLIVLAALAFLIIGAYRGYSVVICAPLAALFAVALTNPTSIAPAFSGLFMEQMVGFIKLYFPVFLLGAVFGKVIELSGFAASIVALAIRYLGKQRTIVATVIVCAILTYGGVSTFVVAFAVYPFAAELFRQSNIPKRLMPAVIALGAFTFSTDSLPGTPQILNIIPTSFFGTTSWAAPVLGLVGTCFTFLVGVSYLNWRRKRLALAGEGYGDPETLLNEPAQTDREHLTSAWIAILPLVVVGVANFALTRSIPVWFGDVYSISQSVFTGLRATVEAPVKPVTAIWAVEGALLLGIVVTVVLAFSKVVAGVRDGSRTAAAGAMLATMNTASEYGFGSVIAALPGFVAVSGALKIISDPLLNAAITVTTLAGITGSASGGVSIALGAIAKTLVENAERAGISMEALHRVVSMAGGGMDTLPHNGAVITLLAVTGLTHRQAYADIFGITLIKTTAVLVVIAFYYATGLV
ncbi:GntP family permease (plasmid) [Agrobacterium leguminum]|uniref:GntP family permease n=1 Tax=Agrobacterium leguminum TaxID=2792015 RepID=UPI0010CA0027|nr:GntP family permease [Agrobacterium leguminum]WFS70061.1 GntP family permease [Agrobacterium leguminum]